MPAETSNGFTSNLNLSLNLNLQLFNLLSPGSRVA
jgi:hypothetical protein